MPIALTIAGSDSSGGAGLQADLKTFHHFGVYGASVVTLITAQSTQQVSRVEVLADDLVAEQLDRVLEDFEVDATKTGALGSRAIAEVVRARAEKLGILVVDPVLRATHGAMLHDDVASLRALLPHVTLLTPNADEASALAERPVHNVVQAEEAARALCDLGAAAVLLKGGHLDESDEVVDLLCAKGEVTRFRSPRVKAGDLHGTGCALASAIAARLALGSSLEKSVQVAISWISRAIAQAPGLGQGNGPIDLFADTQIE